MMTVREFSEAAASPLEICVLIGSEEYYVITPESGKINNRLLDMIGDYIVEDYKANKPDHYAVWVLMRPVKKGEI